MLSTARNAVIWIALFQAGCEAASSVCVSTTTLATITSTVGTGGGHVTGGGHAIAGEHGHTTVIKTVLTTYVAEPTKIAVGNVTYTVSKPTTLTIANYPYTIVNSGTADHGGKRPTANGTQKANSQKPTKPTNSPGHPTPVVGAAGRVGEYAGALAVAGAIALL